MFENIRDRRQVRTERAIIDMAAKRRKEFWARKHQEWLREQELFGPE